MTTAALQSSPSPNSVPAEILVRQFLRTFFQMLRERNVTEIRTAGKRGRDTTRRFRKAWEKLSDHASKHPDIKRLRNALRPDPITGRSEEFLDALVSFIEARPLPGGRGFKLVLVPLGEGDIPHLSDIAQLAADAYCANATPIK